MSELHLKSAWIEEGTRIGTRISLDNLAGLSPIRQRAALAIIGATVADVATRPFHWVYNQSTLDTTVGSEEKVEFWPVSVSPFYSIPTGQRSCYNDESIVMLRSFRPQFDSLYLSPDLYFQANSFQQEIIRLFSPPSDYAFGLHLRKEAYDPTKRMEDREPIAAPWQHAAITDYLQAVTSGNPPAGNPKSTENDGFCSVIPLIARFAVAKAEGKLSSLSQADDVILGAAKLLSSNITALAHTYVTARMLFSIIERGEALKTSEQIFNAIDEDLPDYLSDAVEDIKQNILVVEQSLKKDVTAETARFGKACGNPGSFMGALLAVLQSTNSVANGASQYISAIRKIIRAGGCNCSRANIAGALLGATYGVHGDNENTYVDPLHANLYRSDGGIPITWMLQCDDIETIIDMAVMAVRNL
eukprot:CAMPEP_0173143834 /NCGR_PEP_ID=MMETSP1105-20130129/6892_1 /TAXON_ID=2985 /ORGANISM="Ochromonas sp., Strain BG-1" /LENGTH=415 /DNA_ID=CAMNT_0014057437 /DNA_START=225 /DNA_END=1472 /DNA_ORIENTATION=+